MFAGDSVCIKNKNNRKSKRSNSKKKCWILLIFHHNYFITAVSFIIILCHTMIYKQFMFSSTLCLFYQYFFYSACSFVFKFAQRIVTKLSNYYWLQLLPEGDNQWVVAKKISCTAWKKYNFQNHRHCNHTIVNNKIITVPDLIRLNSLFLLPSIITCSFLFILGFKKWANRIEVQKNDHHNKTIVFRCVFFSFSCNEWCLSSVHGFVFFLLFISLPRCVGIIDWSQYSRFIGFELIWLYDATNSIHRGRVMSMR